jgi:hypothetical protein
MLYLKFVQLATTAFPSRRTTNSHMAELVDHLQMLMFGLGKLCGVLKETPETRVDATSADMNSESALLADAKEESQGDSLGQDTQERFRLTQSLYT